MRKRPFHGPLVKSHRCLSLFQWIKGDAQSLIGVLRHGLEAANIILQIAVTKGVDRRAINLDALEAIVTLYRLHMREHIIPTLNETAHLSFSDQSTHTNPPGSPPRKKRRSAAAKNTAFEGVGHALSKEIRRMYNLISSTFQQYYVLMERMQILVKSMILEDHQVLLITNGSLQILEVQGYPNRGYSQSPGQQMQEACLQIVTAAFGSYPSHRETIVEEILPIIVRLPTAKRSMRAFPVSYTSAASSTMAALNARIMSPFWDQGDGRNHGIQMISALLLSLVQICVKRPTYNNIPQPEQTEQPAPVNLEPTLTSGLEDCKAVANVVIFELLKRCTRSKYGGSTNEYRAFLTNLVQDLLSVLLIPGYPAAETILFALLGRLRRDIKEASNAGPRKSSRGDDSGPENTYLTFCFDLIGKISAVEARILKIQSDRPISVGASTRISSSNEEVVMGCYCGSTDTDTFCISCDDCNVYYHGKCVGIMTTDNLPGEWICDSCRLGQISKRELRNQRIKDEFIMDDHYILRHAFLSSIAHRKGVENIGSAVQYHFARWLDELEMTAAKAPMENKKAKKIVRELVNKWDSIEPHTHGEELTDEGYNRMLLIIFANKSPLACSFKTQISYILETMGDMRAPHLRKLSLKTIEKMAEGDDQLMQLPIIARTVSSRLEDSTISVREAALSFVGNYVVKFPKIAVVFHSSLVKCLADDGLSVRKRAIRIFEEILKTNPHYKGRSEACQAMLQRAAFRKEEDTVRDLIHDLFTKLWLQNGDQIVAGPVSSPQKKVSSTFSPEAASGTNETEMGQFFSPGSRMIKSPSQMRRVDLAAEMMVEVVRRDSNGDSLETFLRKLFDANLEEDRGRRRKSAGGISRQHLDLLIRSLFDHLLALEENRAERGNLIGKDLAASLRTIEVVASSAPLEVMRHIDTVVIPYLKADNGVPKEDEPAIVSVCADIITRVAPTFGKNEISQLAATSVAQDLQQAIYKYGSFCMNSAIRTLSTLAHHPDAEGSDFGKLLLTLANTFYKYLTKQHRITDFSPNKVPQNIRSNVQRSLSVLGLICQHRDRNLGASPIDKDAAFELPHPEDPLPGTITWDNLTFACYQVIEPLLSSKDHPTKCHALRALGNIFLSEPRLLFALEQDGLVENVMSPKAPLPLQLEALELWKKILDSEEKRIDAGHAKRSMDMDKNMTVSKRISGDQDGDSNLFGGVLTNHADRLFEMLSFKDESMRLSAVELLGLLLRQGLLNPNDAVPHLMALQGDVQNTTIRSLALEYMIALGEKWPDMIQQRVRDGVKQACAFQRMLYPTRSQVSALMETSSGVECVFSRVFKECVAKVRKQRHGLYSGLLGLFELKELTQRSPRHNRRSSPTRAAAGGLDLSLLSYAAQILAYLPYASADDPLFIIHRISSIAALQGDQVLDSFESLLKPQFVNEDWDDTNEDEDALERAAKSKFPSRNRVAMPLTDGNFDLKAFARVCQTSTGLSLLFRLKNFLMTTYRLSELRCLDYNPKDKERISDRNLSKVDDAPEFDASLFPGISNSTAVPNVDSLIRQYADFRKGFREEIASSARAQEEKEEQAVNEVGLSGQGEDDEGEALEESDKDVVMEAS